MDLSLRTHADGDHAILEVAGEIDLATAPELRAALSDLLEEAHLDLLVDLRQVTFLDAAGLRVLVAALKRAWLRGVVYNW